MRVLVLLLASASALMPTADGMSSARPLSVNARPTLRPRPVYRLPPSQLRADAGAIQPLPPAPASRWRQVVGSGSWRVGAVTALICLDILCYSFPLPFMPEFLASRCATRTRPAHSLGIGPKPEPEPEPWSRPQRPATPPAPSLRVRLRLRTQGPHCARDLGAALLLLLRRPRLGRDHRSGAVRAACSRRQRGPPPLRAPRGGSDGHGSGERGAGDAALVRCARPEPKPKPKPKPRRLILSLDA